jgi:hypothetical protein
VAPASSRTVQLTEEVLEAMLGLLSAPLLPLTLGPEESTECQGDSGPTEEIRRPGAGDRDGEG